MRFRVEFTRLLPALGLMLAGCAGQAFTADSAPEYLVNRDQVPLYAYGPQQNSAPDAQLRDNDRVRMLRREFGFSLVLIDGGQTGYVANEDLTPAPPSVGHETPARRSRAGEVPRRKIPPLPISEEPPLPKPDLDVAPSDAPPR